MKQEILQTTRLGATLIVMASLGYYFGKTELYEGLYGDKLECRLTADQFIMDALP